MGTRTHTHITNVLRLCTKFFVRKYICASGSVTKLLSFYTHDYCCIFQGRLNTTKKRQSAPKENPRTLLISPKVPTFQQQVDHERNA